MFRSSFSLRTPGSGFGLVRRAGEKGFVLVAILLLIALSLVIIVTTSSISQIERKAVVNSSKEELARENALFALGVAMSQLQKEAGPDQRVTATADLFNTNGTSSVAQPYWTGVWKSYNPQWAVSYTHLTLPTILRV